MKLFSSLTLAACFVAILAGNTSAQLLSLPTQVAEAGLSQATSTLTAGRQDQEQEQDIANKNDGKMLFNCRDWEWQRVIEIFTERTGLDLQPVDEYPEGTVTIYSDQPYTVMQGLDRLNMNLAIKGYTLIRKENQLFLVELRNMDENMAAIIEQVKPSDLESRGLYEVMRTTFDLSGLLDADELEDSISARITNRTHRQYLQYIPGAKLIKVQETGTVLREIHGWVQAAREEAVKKAPGRRKYTVENLPVEIVLELARPLIGLGEEENSRTFEDGTSLTMVSDPVERIIWVRSSNEKIDEVFDVFKDIDIAPPETDMSDVAKKFLAKHDVTFDRDIAMQIMQSFFEGRDVVLDQDGQSGAILLYGTEKDHKDADDYLAVGANDFGSGIKSIALKYRTQTEAISFVNQVFGITVATDGTTTGDGPKIIPIPDTDAVFVMGNPQQVRRVEKMLAEFDVQSADATSGIVTRSRFLPMSETEARRLLNPDLEFIFRDTGRRNKLNFVTPEERSIPRRTLMELDQMQDDFERQFDLPAEQRSTTPDRRRENDQSNNTDLDFNRYQFASTKIQDQDPVGQTSEDLTDQDSDQRGSYYVPPEIPESIPGSDIELRLVEGGVVVESDDLSALEDMVDLLYRLQAEVSEEDMPAVFHIKYRRPDVVKTLLDQYIGLASSGGGGGGGGNPMGNLLGNVMGNAMGGAGDLFGGLLGGGGDAGGLGGGYVLEGDVTTFADMKLNYILVKGHTVNDYDMIRMYIELLDRPEADYEIDLVGKMRVIEVIYRDPQEVYDLIVAALPEYIETGDGGGGGSRSQEQDQARMMQQMMKAIGGGGGGGQSVDTEAEKPKATISVDETKSALVVTGPKYIYDKIAEMVATIDVKPAVADEQSRIVTVEGIDPALVAQYLETVYQGKITIVQGEAGQAEGTSQAQTNSQDSARQRAAQQQRNAAMQQIMQQAMQRQQRGGGGGRGAGGGGGRGGGGRGGGGRGGR